MTGAAVFLKVIVTAAIIVAGAVLAIWLLVKGTQGLIWLLSHLFRGIAFLVAHVFRFVKNTLGDSFRSVGALMTAIVLVPLTVLNFLFGRWSAGRHYGRALEDELISFALGIYRVALGNPLHFVGMGMLTDGFERRLPEVVARAPRSPKARVKDGKFTGYKVTGVLPAGGSGARLFLAKPRPEKLKELLAAGHADPGQVVIKAFSLSAGSTLPQIVRESRALQSARQLGLVLEHELTDKSFHYVMPYVPGENLDAVIGQMHDNAGTEGLSDRQLRVALGYAGDLLYTLQAFHEGGLWHKDIKPSNLIVSEGRAHLVDLGLVTPLASAMTLTTHGTEYFRDPEMVRQAMRGVKVHEVNGVKFDIYSAGAVLYTLIENSFPAHGSLSRFTKRAPEAMVWIVRRAMSDLEGRYGSAHEMLEDIRTVLAARDPFAVRPADLPSVNGKASASTPRGRFRKLAGGAFGSGASASSSFAEASRVAAETASKASLAAMAAHEAAKSERRRQRDSKRFHRTATAIRDQRRSTGRSLIAAFVGMLFLAGLATVGLLGTRMARSSAPVSVSFHEDPVAWCLENESDEPLPQVEVDGLEVPTTPSPVTVARIESGRIARHAGQHVEKLRRQWSRKLDEAFEHLAGQGRCLAESAEEGLECAGSILLLGDLAAANGRELIEALEGELEERDFQVFGDRAAQAGDERDILYLAGARRAMGVSDPDDPEALARLEHYLAENPSLDALIWLSEGEEPDTVQYRFVLPRDCEEKPQGDFALSSQN